MKHIKKYNESFFDQIYDQKRKTINEDTKIEDFTEEFKKLINQNELQDEDEYDMVDLLSLVGELCNDYNMTSNDLKKVIDNGDDEMNIIKILFDETLNSENKPTSKNWNSKELKELLLDFITIPDNQLKGHIKQWINENL